MYTVLDSLQAFVGKMTAWLVFQSKSLQSLFSGKIYTARRKRFFNVL